MHQLSVDTVINVCYVVLVCVVISHSTYRWHISPPTDHKSVGSKYIDTTFPSQRQAGRDQWFVHGLIPFVITVIIG